MSEPSVSRRLFVVYNPNSIDALDVAKEDVAEACRRHGWAEATWIETTPEETGTKQGREAVEAGADVVCVAGGDGTVRAVATALVRTGVPLGFLPAGTGNLLARNLDLPISTVAEAIDAVLGGRDRTIDVGLIRTGEHEVPQLGEGDEPADDEEVFLVMSGLGLDGDIMANANENVKKVVGWPAYVLSAAKTVVRRGFRVSVDAGEGTIEGGISGTGERPARLRRHARTVVVGNCGTLQGGLELMPDARLDDEILDGVVLAPKGFFGWASVLSDVVTRHRRGHRRLDRFRSRTVVVASERPVEAEIDGDPIGARRGLAMRVLPEALVVRVG